MLRRGGCLPVDEELTRRLHQDIPTEVGESLLQRLGFVELAS